MRFSNKAYKYLDKLNRDKEFVIADSNEVVNYLAKQNITAFHSVIDFQMKFSGLELTISKNPGSTFNARLFSRSNVAKNTKIELVKVNGQSYFFCGDHETAQIWFVLSEQGQLCTYNSNNGSVNTIFSSFDKFIETYALEDLLSKENKYEHPSFYDLINPKEFDRLTKDYFLHLTASDDYHKWLSSGDIVIHKGTWYDRAACYVHVYGDTKQRCETFVNSLKSAAIIA